MSNATAPEAECDMSSRFATFIAACTARCEHCAPGGYDTDADPGSFTNALRSHGTDYMRP
jgi:hypothetical protein